MEVPDFTGWASKNDLECSDGRTIRRGAFAHQDGVKVPLVWQHQRTEPSNVLGHAFLSNRNEGVYTQAFFNDSPSGQNAKLLVEHGDVESLSIYANQLKQQGGNVMHGSIQEVSLVLIGANPGACIDSINLAHGDGYNPVDDEGIIYTGEEIIHGDEIEAIDTEGITNEGDNMEKEELVHADGTKVLNKDETVQDVYDSMDAKQQEVLHYMVGEALEQGKSDGGSVVKHGTEITGEDLTHQYQEGFNMARNVFETADKISTSEPRPTLTHSQLQTIMDDAPRLGSVKESFLAHAGDYGIDDIELLFPDATLDANGISYIARRSEWVQSVLSTTKHSPFSRIKSLAADLTADEARAKGYVKGSLKKDEVIKMLKRTTTPTTIYKKQKLDRDDIVDITEIDIIQWLKTEMRVMLDEEIARAILVGDNREADDPDKINEDNLRPIAYDVDMYNTVVNLTTGNTAQQNIDQIVRAMSNYKGTGTPTMYTTNETLTDLILSKDTLGRRFYNTIADLSAAIRVSTIIPVEALETDTDIVAVIVNLADYTVGADKGGEINTFDDFDIDYNQQKYLIETRISGALTKPKSAITIKITSGNVVTPGAPTFVASTGVLTIPTEAGVVYTNADTGVAYSAGAQTAIAAGATVDVEAVPAAGYGFTHDTDATWTFTRDAS